MNFIASNYWLIPALPLAAAAVGALTPRTGRKLAAGAAITAMAGALALSCLLLLTSLITLNAHEYHNFTWFELGE